MQIDNQNNDQDYYEEERVRFYLCDPEKNVECNKENCWYNKKEYWEDYAKNIDKDFADRCLFGCRFTTNPEFAKTETYTYQMLPDGEQITKTHPIPGISFGINDGPVNLHTMDKFVVRKVGYDKD